MCDCSDRRQRGGEKDGNGRGGEGGRMYTAGERGGVKRKDSIVCEMVYVRM